MKSIKTRLAAYFMFIVIITVVILEVLLVGIVKQNYYKNLEDSLVSQLKAASAIYGRYYSDSTLYENVINNVDIFWKQATTAQVEIIDLSGKVLMDSTGMIPPDTSKMGDVREAAKGGTGKWVGMAEYTGERIMAVSCLLKSGEEHAGILRFITSMRVVDDEIGRITWIFTLVGGMVIIICGCVSIFLANSIIRPLKEVTKAAGMMAAGNFKDRSTKRTDDEIGKLSDTLNFMAEEILKKDQLKNDFISSVSHELRTPLTSIKGWAVTLKSGSLEDGDMMLDGLEIIEKESDRLTLMVEELLDFSRFVSGKVSIKKERVNVFELAEHIKTQLAPRAARDNIEFSVACDENLPEIASDENRLKQVFINLMDNAFRFTPPGGSVIFHSARIGSSMVFTVKDTGCGIMPEELPKIKEKFYKGKNSKSINGIGLSICDELIRLMGGRLDIRSEVDKGTEVVVSLPLQEGVSA